MLSGIILNVAFYLLLYCMTFCWVSHFDYYYNECQNAKFF